MKKRFAHIVILALIPFVAFMEYSLTSFQHYHVTEDGLIVCHSHPYNSGEGQHGSHEHKTCDLAGFKVFDPLLLNLSEGFVFKERLPRQVYVLRSVLSDPSVAERHLYYPILRGPPVFFATI